MSVFNYLDFSGMLNIWVGDFQKPVNELSSCKNVQEDRIGILKRVPGYSKASTDALGSTAKINFLHHYFQASANSWAGQSYLVAWFGSGTGYTFRKKTTAEFDGYIGGTISDRFDLEPYAINYLDKMFIVGYDPVDKLYMTPTTIKWTTVSTSDTDTTWMPSGRYIVRYRDLPYVLYTKIGSDIYPSRAYYPVAPVNMAIPAWGWDTPYNFEQFGQDDGDEITGGADAYDKLVVFKTRSMWTYDQEQTKKIAEIGCDSAKSIQVIWGILYWANRDGIWRWAGDLPQLISGKVQPLFDEINQSKLGEMVASNYGFEYRLFVWDITYGGHEYLNTWICFDVRREKFYIRCTSHKPFSTAKYLENGKERMYFGSTAYVYKQSTYVDEVNSDDWNEIDYFFTTNNLDFWAPQTVKNSPNIYLFTKNCGGMKYTFDTDARDKFDIPWGQITNSNFQDSEMSATGNRIAVKFYGKDSNKPFEFEWFIFDVEWVENVQPRNYGL